MYIILFLIGSIKLDLLLIWFSVSVVRLTMRDCYMYKLKVINISHNTTPLSRTRYYTEVGLLFSALQVQCIYSSGQSLRNCVIMVYTRMEAL